MSTVLGLDLSLRRSGLALWRDGHKSTAHVGYDSVNAKNDRARVQRSMRVAQAIFGPEHVGPMRGHIDLAVIERYLVRGRNPGADIDIAQLHGFVVSVLISWRIPFAYVHNGTLKAFATGKGTATKQQMCAHALAHGWAPANHDEADAAHLASFGALHLGDPVPFEVTDWRLAGLEKVAWPKARVRA